VFILFDFFIGIKKAIALRCSFRFYFGGVRGVSHVTLANLIRHWFLKIIKKRKRESEEKEKGEREKNCPFSLLCAGG